MHSGENILQILNSDLFLVIRSATLSRDAEQWQRASAPRQPLSPGGKE